MADFTRLPFWPAALNQAMAATYCGLSTDTFKKVCPIKPIRFTDSAWGERYLRQRLDEWLLSLDTNGPAVPAIKFEYYFSGVTNPTNRQTSSAQRLREEQAEPGSLASWRRQNEERKMFAPRHQLRANQNRVLHILQSHPDGLPVDSIPGAAEKTMALLAKLDLVESSVDGTSGDRIWRLSQYGKEELERAKIYLNWKR